MIWYRVAGIRHARGTLSAEGRRLVRFLSYQRLGRFSGRIIGRRGYDEVDGGMQLAERYSAVHNLAPDAFWVDLRRLLVLGLVERVVSPAPGRKAVYALCLRTDAIPHDLPKDLARVLRVWQLPDVEPEPAAEDASYGHLTASAADLPQMGEPFAVELAQRQAADLGAAPRWEHPVSSPAAQVAASLAQSIRALRLDEDRPDWKCAAVAAPAPGAQVAEWFKQWLATTPETSPLYAKAFDPCGFVSTGSAWPMFVKDVEKTNRTPSAAAGKRCWLPSGDDPRVVAKRVMTAAWAAWRRELGYGKVILRSRRSEETGEAQGDPYADLLRTIVIALPRSSEGELIEVLTGSVASAEDVGRVAGARLWRLINSRSNKHAYKPIPKVRQAKATTRYDEETPAQRARRRELAAAGNLPGGYNPARDAARAREREQREHLAAQVEAERIARLRRWGIELGPLREAEQVHQAATAPPESAPVRPSDASRAAALQKARAEKRERKRREMGL